MKVNLGMFKLKKTIEKQDLRVTPPQNCLK